MNKVNFWLGSDPELMLRDVKTNQLKSAIPIIPEGKKGGRRLDVPGKNFVLHDNVLVEFNTEPAETNKDFVKTLGQVLVRIEKDIAKSGVKLCLQTSADFPESELNSGEARLFGCEADYDAYALVRNEMEDEAAHQPFRSAGGHLHIGCHEKSPELTEILNDPSGLGKVKVVKALDIFVGIISTFLDKDVTSKKRRSLYGRAGSHRPKEYGVEYRASGNWWLASPKHAKLLHKLSEPSLALALDEQEMSS